MINRRSLLKFASVVPMMATVPRLVGAADNAAGQPADYTLRIGAGLVELAPDRIVSTTLYNGQFPGPLLRFKEGQPWSLMSTTTPIRPNSCIGMGK